MKRDSGPKFVSSPREVLILGRRVGRGGAGYSGLKFLSPP